MGNLLSLTTNIALGVWFHSSLSFVKLSPGGERDLSLDRAKNSRYALYSSFSAFLYDSENGNGGMEFPFRLCSRILGTGCFIRWNVRCLAYWNHRWNSRLWGLRCCPRVCGWFLGWQGFSRSNNQKLNMIVSAHIHSGANTPIVRTINSATSVRCYAIPVEEFRLDKGLVGLHCSSLIPIVICLCYLLHILTNRKYMPIGVIELHG